MIAVIGVEMALAIVATLAFIVLFGPPVKEDREMWWHVVCFMVATGIIEPAALVPLLFGVQLPVFIYILSYGAVDAVVIWRLAIMIRKRHGEVEE